MYIPVLLCLLSDVALNLLLLLDIAANYGPRLPRVSEAIRLIQRRGQMGSKIAVWDAQLWKERLKHCP